MKSDDDFPGWLNEEMGDMDSDPLWWVFVVAGTITLILMIYLIAGGR